MKPCFACLFFCKTPLHDRKLPTLSFFCTCNRLPFTTMLYLGHWPCSRLERSLANYLLQKTTAFTLYYLFQIAIWRPYWYLIVLVASDNVNKSMYLCTLIIFTKIIMKSITYETNYKQIWFLLTKNFVKQLSSLIYTSPVSSKSFL